MFDGYSVVLLHGTSESAIEMVGENRHGMSGETSKTFGREVFVSS
jgi:hypothetical protein